MDLFAVGLNSEKQEERTFDSLKKIFDEVKTRPLALVFHPTTLEKVKFAIPKRQCCGSSESLIMQYAMGYELYSSVKVPEGVVKVAYSKEEVQEICADGMTKAEEQRIQDYLRGGKQ